MKVELLESNSQLIAWGKGEDRSLLFPERRAQKEPTLIGGKQYEAFCTFLEERCLYLPWQRERLGGGGWSEVSGETLRAGDQRKKTHFYNIDIPEWQIFIPLSWAWKLSVSFPRQGNLKLQNTKLLEERLAHPAWSLVSEEKSSSPGTLVSTRWWEELCTFKSGLH